MTTLGVDWGRARSGVAVSDELGLLAHPLAVVESRSMEDLAEQLTKLAESRRADTVVLGLPKNMDGSEGPSAATVRDLAERLRRKSGCAVVLWDERLTTFEAEARLAEFSSGRRKKGRKDQAAACLILQGYLDSKKMRGPGATS